MQKKTHKILETERTILRELVADDDAEFILGLLNQPSFIKFIGDRNVRTAERARDYIESCFTASREKSGFGMWAVESKETGEPMGICGFVRREFLPDADIGFAFLPEFERKGFGFETATATLRYGADVLNFARVLAVVSQTNENSIKLLEKLGFEYENLIELPHVAEKLKLFSIEIFRR